jgi:pSer/pThr/pTyr-binding forkhead associated (FHA) protein
MTSAISHSIAMQLIPADPEASSSLSLDRYPVVLGRGDEVDYQIEDRFLSRCHCQLDCEDGVVTVRDLDSRHGTFVNESRTRETVLSAGDTLRIGLTRFVVSFLDV